MIDRRMASGPYTDFGEPKVKRETGRYYVEYPIKFKNAENLFYITFLLENISPDATIFGLSISDKPEQ